MLIKSEDYNFKTLIVKRISKMRRQKQKKAKSVRGLTPFRSLALAFINHHLTQIVCLFLWMDILSWDQPLSDGNLQQYMRLRIQLKIWKTKAFPPESVNAGVRIRLATKCLLRCINNCLSCCCLPQTEAWIMH